MATVTKRSNERPDADLPADIVTNELPEGRRILPGDRRVVDPRPEPPAPPENIVKTELAIKAAEKNTLPTAERASFFSHYRDYRLGLDPVLVELIQGHQVTRAGTGFHIQFRDHFAIVEGAERIKQCLEHKRFGVDFDLDERDPTGYWRRNGYLEEKVVERTTVVRTKKSKS